MRTKHFIFALWSILLIPFLEIKAEDATRQANVFEQEANRFLKQERYQDAIDYYIRSMDMSRLSENKHTYARCLLGIGLTYSRIGDIDKAVFYLKKAYDEASAVKDTSLMADAAHYLASSYCIKIDVKKAKYWLAVFDNKNWGSPVMNQYYRTYVNMFVSMLEGNIDRSIRYGSEAIRCAESNKLGNRYIFVCYGVYVYLFLQKGDFEQALKNAEIYGRYARESGQRTRLQGYYEIMRDIYKQKGDSLRSKKYELMATNLSDSVIRRSQIDSLNNQLLEYQSKEAKEDVRALNMRINRHLFANLVFAVITFLLLALIAIVVVSNRRMKKAQLQLIRKNDELMNAEKKNKELLKQHYSTSSTSEKGIEEEEPTVKGGISLSTEQANQLLNRILSVFEDVSMISRQDFNLNMLAQETGSNTSYISWVINNTYKKNFKTLLSEYRIREACRCIADKENYGHLTMQAIYKQLGYSSASAFIAAFKNVMGMTPSAYQKRIKEKKAVGETGNDD